jgi:hypothetical protein
MTNWPGGGRLLIFVAVLAMSALSLAQGAIGRLHGQVIDPTGAVIPNAEITVKNATGQTFSAKSDAIGTYTVKDLPPGKYTISVNEKGFAPYSQEVDVASGQEKKLNITLEIAVQEQHIDVQGDAARVTVAPDNNASSVVISGKDLDALSDDPDELQSELQALAGPSAGPNGGQIYIDGFTGGQLPPKSSIREIRINQNPFSAQYDRMGFGRIEILTKPGTDKVHGQFLFNDNHSFLDAKNPFAGAEGDFDTQMFNGNVGGPLGKKASYLVSMERRNINDIAVISQQALAVAPGQVASFVPNPHMRTNISPRIDYQLTANNTLTMRYQFVRDTQNNAGVGQLTLPSYAFNSNLTEHTVQISDTQVLGAKAVNETRFEYERTSNDRNALNSGPAIIVQDTFTGGGNPIGISGSTSDHYELQNYTSINRGTHFLRLGGRLRATSESSTSTQNFNGSYIFSSLQDFTAGKPSQFSLVIGEPNVSNTFVDAGLYAEDDWRLRPNMTLSYGLRYETQNDIQDHADWAPRVGFAWGVGGGKKAAPKTVIRTGFGIFYDRVGQDIALQVLRQNGVTQQQFFINDRTPNGPALLAASFPNVPPLNALVAAAGPPTLYTLASDIRAPYTIQSAVAVERQINKSATASITYIHSRGVHQLVLLNTNAPLNPGDITSRPNPALGNVFQYTSGADFKQNQLIGNVTIRAGQRLTLFSYYSLGFANSDTGGPNSVASNSSNISADYGRAAFDVRSRLFLGGSVGLPHGFRVSPFVLFFSGAPFNITTGLDNNGDFVFNDRPAFDSGIPGHTVVPARDGFPAFDLTPSAGQPLIPINFGDGPSQFTLNLRLSKTIGMGPKLEAASPNQQQGSGPGGGHDHGPGGRGPGGHGPVMVGRGPGGGPFGAERSSQKYSLTFSANARNLLNHTNPATPIGVLSSPFFGSATGLAGGPFNTQSANRRVDLQVMFAF